MNEPTPAPEFTITRTLDAPRELVWRAWTEEKELAHWLYPNGVRTPPESIAFDVRKGGRYSYTMIAANTGEEFPTGGVFLEVLPVERLAFTWARPEDPVEGSPVATVTLTARGDRTEMVFHLRGVAGRPGDGDVYDGWDEALANLAAHLSDHPR